MAHSFYRNGELTTVDSLTICGGQSPHGVITGAVTSVRRMGDLDGVGNYWSGSAWEPMPGIPSNMTAARFVRELEELTRLNSDVKPVLSDPSMTAAEFKAATTERARILTALQELRPIMHKRSDGDWARSWREAGAQEQYDKMIAAVEKLA